MIGFKVHRFENVTSTNDVAMELAGKGAAEGEVVVASKQTKGRGRAGRVWESDSADNIYMSVILRPASVSNIACITLVAGISVAEALSPHVKGELKVKWPNDIWLGGKKVCGILTESDGGLVVVGIGMNINSMPGDFSPEVGKIATSLKMDTGREFDIEKVVGSVCERLNANYALFNEEGFAPFKGMFDRWSLLGGKRVEAVFGKDVVSGIARGIDDDGALLVERNGKLERVIAGDVNLCF